MGARWDLFVDWLDSQISVKPGLFYTDFRFLVALPFWPLLAVAYFTPRPIQDAIVVAGLIVMIPWGWLIIHRRALKKRNWVEPDRWYDDTNGY